MIAIAGSVVFATGALRGAGDGAEARVADRFERPDATTLGATPTGERWRVDAVSDWGVEDGRALVVDGPPNGYATAWVRTDVVGDAIVSADVTLSPTPGRSNAGLVLRYADADDHLWTKLELTEGHPRGMLSIGKVSDGRLTSLLGHADGIGLEPGRTYHLEARIEGRVVTATVRGPGLATGVGASYTLSDEEASAFGRNTGYGLRTKLAFDEDDGGSRWDNFSVAAG